MKIKRIKAVGIKGGDFEHELTDVTLVCGRNFTGKTARLEAIRLALMGYLPELGKANGATMGLSRNGSLTVELELADGRQISRSWKRGKTGVKAEAMQGVLPETPAVLIDPSGYFGLGDKDRVRYVFGLLREIPLTADDVIAGLKNIRLEDNTAESERVIRELAEWVDDTDRARHDAGGSVQDWLDEIVAGTKEKLKMARQNADRMAKTIQGLTQMQADEMPSDDVKGALAQARQRTVYLGNELAVLNDRIRNVSKIHQEIATLSKLVRSFEERASEYDIPAMSKELNELAGSEHVVPDVDGLLGLQRELMLRESKLSGQASSERQRIEALEKEISEINDLKACPTCRCKGKGWRENLIGNRSVELAQCEARFAEYTKSCDTATADLDACTAKLDTARKLKADLDAWSNRIVELKAKLSVAKSNAAELERTKSRLVDLGQEVAGVALPTEKRAEIETAIAVAQAEVNSLEEVQRKVLASKQDAAKRAQAIIEHGELQVDVTVLSEGVKVLEAMQAKLVEDAFATVLAKANMLTEGILLSPLDFKDGEIGRWNGGTWVRHKAFSGTEKALAYAAISVALAADAPCKIVMIDELGRLDGANLKALVKRARELVDAGTIDQFIGVCTMESAAWGHDAGLIQLESEVAQ